MSLKGDKYETTEEVRFRLENTVVMYDNKPVYITRVNVPEPEERDKGEVARVYFYELPYKPGSKEVRKFLSSKKFDLAPFRMGYMNFNGSAVFVSRVPNRQNKQGLSNNTCKIADIKGRRPLELSFNKLIKEQSFVDMINGKFPSFADAGKLLDDERVSSVAVSRSFAFTINHELELLVLRHKGIPCGVAMKGDKALKLSPKFVFLREVLEQCKIPIL